MLVYYHGPLGNTIIQILKVGFNGDNFRSINRTISHTFLSYLALKANCITKEIHIHIKSISQK